MKHLSGPTGILVVNLGTPDAPSRGAVRRYLKQFLLDPRVIDIPAVPRHLLVRGLIAPFRAGSSSKLYKQVWTDEGSPIKIYAENLVEGLQEHFEEGIHVELAMRYQNPSIQAALDKFQKMAVSKIIVLPLFPQYASASTGSVHEEVMRIVSSWFNVPDIRFINSYPLYEPMIKLYADNARKYDVSSFDHIFFSFHGLPESQLRKGDVHDHCLKKEYSCCNTLTKHNQFCYRAQCVATAHAIAAELDLKEEDYTICFQSRLGTDPWIQPYTTDVLEERAEKGDKRILAFSPAFVADCLETTIEISVEYQEEFEEMGGEKMQLVESLNDDPRWISALVDLLVEYDPTLKTKQLQVV